MDTTTVSNAIIDAVRKRGLPIKTITLDNGFEFSRHELIVKGLGYSVYFAKPYCWNDKALVENHNKLIRDFVPKGSDFTLLDKNYWFEIENTLNNRPREILGFKTPNEMVAQELQRCCTLNSADTS